MAETFLYLNTTGWKTGQTHHIEIWYVEHQGRYYLCSGGGERAHWVQNIAQEPRVSFYIAERGAAHEPATPATARALAPQAHATVIAPVRTAFSHKYGWNDGLIVEITPQTPGGATHE